MNPLNVPKVPFGLIWEKIDFKTETGTSFYGFVFPLNLTSWLSTISIMESSICGVVCIGLREYLDLTV